jgi:hypothetical protein
MLSRLSGAVAQSFRSKRVQSDRSYVSSCVGVIAVILILYGGPARAETRVLLLRGWFGVFSTGLDAIADALNAKGIHAEAIGHLAWKTAADDILRARAGQDRLDRAGGPLAGRQQRHRHGAGA